MRWFVAVIAVIATIIIVVAAFVPSSKIIWTYWHDETQIPDVARKCMATWKFHNPEYQIIVLTPAKVKKLTKIDLDKLNIAHEFHQRRADFARLFVLAKYGGVWMDATIVCTRPLKTWIRSDQYFFGFYAPHTTDSKFPIPENWFFVTPAYSPFMVDWLEECLRMLSFPSENDYIAHIKTTDTNMQNLPSMLPYLVLHLCATVVMQRHPEKYHIQLLPAIDGPLKYLADNDWDAAKSLEALCADPALTYPIIKLRGAETKHLKTSGECFDVIIAKSMQ